jgi:hypothetical protein
MSNFWRLVIHIPHGFIAGVFTPFSPVSGIVYSVGFMYYQYIEDWRIADHSYLDFRGWLVGYPLGFVVGYILSRVILCNTGS